MSDHHHPEPTRRTAGRRDTDAVVTISVRDLLTEMRAEQAAGFARLETALASKADRSELSKLEARVDGHADRLDKVEGWQHDRELTVNVHTEHQQRAWTLRSKIAATLLSVAMLVATLLAPYFATHVL